MRTQIRTKKAPLPAAGYAQATVSGQLIFISGQVANDPKTGTVLTTSIEGQVTQALRNVEEIVKAAGGNKDSIMRCGIFLSDLADFAKMDGAYREFFGKALPARTTVQVGLGVYRVEIDAIAVRIQKGDRRTKK